MTGREFGLVFVFAVLLVISNLVTCSVAGSPGDEPKLVYYEPKPCSHPDINLECPNPCPEVPPCPEAPDCICNPVPVKIETSDNVRCFFSHTEHPEEGPEVEIPVFYCEEVEINIKQEFKPTHGASLGAGWDSGLTSASAFKIMGAWHPKWQHKRAWVPSLVVDVTRDLEEFDPNASIDWIYPMCGGGRCARPEPFATADVPPQTRFGITALFRIFK